MRRFGNNQIILNPKYTYLDSKPITSKNKYSYITVKEEVEKNYLKVKGDFKTLEPLSGSPTKI
jgi:hypothetical protein